MSDGSRALALLVVQQFNLPLKQNERAVARRATFLEKELALVESHYLTVVDYLLHHVEAYSLKKFVMLQEALIYAQVECLLLKI